MSQRLIATTLFFALTAATPTALAQGQGYDPSQQGQQGESQHSPPQAQPAAVTTEELKKYVSAGKQVDSLRGELAEQLKGVQDQQEAQTLQQQTQEKMIQAVQAEGLSVNTFNRIAAMAQTDETLKKRIQDLD